MKIVERVLEKWIRALVNLNEMQFGFMPGKGTTDALFILRRMQEEYREKGEKLYMCFVDSEKAFDRVDHQFMFEVLDRMAFPTEFINWIRLLYTSSSSSVRINNITSKKFIY